MSLFDDLMGSYGLPLLFDELGQDVTYTPDGGSDVPCTGIVGHEETEEDDTFDGRRRRQVREVTISTDPAGVYGGVASPSLTATVTIGGVEYAVEEIRGLAAHWVRLGLKRRPSIEVGREGYRRK